MMNERIAKLASKAGFDVSSDGKFGNYSQMYKIEKFAELIVRECIKVIETNHPEFDCKESADNLIRRAGRMDAMDEIKQHFEVESRWS